MGKKLGIGVMLLVFLIVGVEIVYIFVLKEKELTKSEWVQNVEKLIEKTDIDVVDKKYEDTYTYTLENGKIDNLNCKGLNLKQTNGQIIYDKIGIGSYVIHNNKWCAKKTSFMEEMEVTDYEKDSCVLESNDELEDNGSDKELEDKDSDKESENNKPVDDKEEKATFSIYEPPKTVTSPSDRISLAIKFNSNDFTQEDIVKYEFSVNNNEWQETDSEIFHYFPKITGIYLFQARVTTKTGQKYVSEIYECYFKNDISAIRIELQNKTSNSFTVKVVGGEGLKWSKYEFSIDGKKYVDNQGNAVFTYNTDKRYNKIKARITDNKGNKFETRSFVVEVNDKRNITDTSCFAFDEKERMISDYSVNNTYCTTEVIIPSSIKGIPVEKIGYMTFQSQHLTKVVIPETIKEIGISAFESNELTSVDLSSNVTSIGERAFLDNRLTNIDIPSNVTNIGASTFSNNELTSVNIPSNVINIDVFAFSNNKLTSVEIPSKVTNIGAFAFSNNELTSVKIPFNVTYIGRFAFSDNRLTSIDLPSSVTTIDDNAFSDNMLTSVTIPSSVQSLEHEVFRANQLTSVIIEGKSSPSDFEIYEEEIWSWQEGYDDSNIIWNG